MSWSVSLIGRPENIVKALQEESNRLNGQSKVEFDAVLPSLIVLCDNNFAKSDSGYVEPMLHLEASGSGVEKNGEQIYRSAGISLKSLYGRVV